MAAQLIDAVSWFFLVTGGLFVIAGGIGLIRLPDFYTRVHAAGITDTVGAWMILIGLMFQAGLTLVTLKLIIVLFFLLATCPLSSHALTKAAFFRGLKPLLGDQNDTEAEQ